MFRFTAGATPTSPRVWGPLTSSKSFMGECWKATTSVKREKTRNPAAFSFIITGGPPDNAEWRYHKLSGKEWVDGVYESRSYRSQGFPHLPGHDVVRRPQLARVGAARRPGAPLHQARARNGHQFFRHGRCVLAGRERRGDGTRAARF